MKYGPLSIADILDRGIEILTGRAFLFFFLSLAVQFPSYIIIFGAGRLITMKAGGAGLLFPGILWALPVLLILWYFHICTRAVFCFITSEEYRDRPVTAALVFSRPELYSGRMAAYSAVTFSLLSTAFSLPLVFLIYLHFSGKNIEESLPFAAVMLLFFTVMLIFTYVRLSLAIPAMITGNGGVFQSMGKSWSLTSGHSVKITATAALIQAVITVAAIVPGFYLWWLVPALTAFLLPAGAVFETLLFYDLMTETEAYDLLLLADELNTSC